MVVGLTDLRNNALGRFHLVIFTLSLHVLLRSSFQSIYKMEVILNGRNNEVYDRHPINRLNFKSK